MWMWILLGAAVVLGLVVASRSTSGGKSAGGC